MSIKRQPKLAAYPSAIVVLALPCICFGESPPGDTDKMPASLPVANMSLLLPALLESAEAEIGTITILNKNIFDLEDPEENRALFRLANKLHFKTRPSVVKRQLLFGTGESFSAQSLEESERVLRENRYLQDVLIRPVAFNDGRVDIDVQTSDVWTMMPKLAFSRAGGVNKVNAGIREMNLLGSGAAIELGYKSDVDRESTILRFQKRNLGESWYGANLLISENSDGHFYNVDLGKPFYSLDSRDTRGISMTDLEQTESLYDLGEVVSEYRRRGASTRLYNGWSSGLRNGWTTRILTGFGFEEQEYFAVDGSNFDAPDLPRDRHLIYPFVGFEKVQDKFETTSNYDHIERVEDRFLGTRYAATVGLASANAGSDRNAIILRTSAQTGIGSSEKSSLLLGISLDGRVEGGHAENVMLHLGAKYYHRQSDRRLLYVGLDGRFGSNLDIEQYQTLGGDTGLRGYPLRYQMGEKRFLLTIEQRYFTDWYPFRLFRVGGAAFFDAGEAWGDSPVPGHRMGVLRNVGLGLRLGSTRSGVGRMIHVDIAYALDGETDMDKLQFLVSTRKSF